MSSKKSTVKLYREKTGAKPSKELTELVRKQAIIKNKIMNVLKSGPKTIPEVAKEVGMPIHEVTWYILTFNKYKLVEPIEKTDEGYWKYKAVS